MVLSSLKMDGVTTQTATPQDLTHFRITWMTRSQHCQGTIVDKVRFKCALSRTPARCLAVVALTVTLDPLPAEVACEHGLWT